MGRKFLLHGKGINGKTGKDIEFRVPFSISAATLKLFPDGLLATEVTFRGKTMSVYDSDENSVFGSLEFPIFILENMERTPGHEKLLSELKLEVMARDTRTPSAVLDVFVGIAGIIRERLDKKPDDPRLNILREVTEDALRELEGKANKNSN